jgi:hypothetical protein
LFERLNNFGGNRDIFFLQIFPCVLIIRHLAQKRLMGPKVNARQVRSGPRDSLSLNPVLERNSNNILKWHRLPLSYAFPHLQVGPITLLLPSASRVTVLTCTWRVGGSEGFHLQSISLLISSRSKEGHAFLNLLNVTRALRNLGKAYPSAREPH